MSKMKTRSAAKKRFRLTGTGKVKCKRAFTRHILTSKTPKRKRNLRGGAIVHKALSAKIALMIK
jgi:large subunit ribosomal protein L35